MRTGLGKLVQFGLRLIVSQHPPEQVEARCIEVTVEGNGHDLRQLIAQRQDIFTAYLQMKPEKRKER